MASSGYYKGKRDYWAGEEKKYIKWVKELEEIAKNYTHHEIRFADNDLNTKIDVCESGTRQGLSGGGSIVSNRSEIIAAKECEAIDDACISSSRISVYSEIAGLQSKRDDARSRKDDYARQYSDALRAEAACFFKG